MATHLTGWRREFPVTERCVYFDHAGVAPVSRRVVAAVNEFISDACQSGRINYKSWEERGEAARAAFATLIGSSADEVAFVGSTSDGLAAIATGIDWQAGDNVLAVSGEFPANVYPWWSLKRFGVETRMVTLENFRLTVANIDRCADQRTRLVAVSAVDFATGQRRPLAEIGEYCSERGIIFCVDAIQALGAVSIDVERERIDCLAADGHKWLCAPEGCGCLYLARRMWEHIRPQRVGWKSVVDQSRYLPYHFSLKPNALKFEPGSLNLLALHALAAALELTLEIGVQEIEESVLSLTGQLRAGLAERGFSVISPGGPSELSGITTFRGLKDPTAAERRLREQMILVRERLGGIRLSPHFYCSAEDVARFFSALDQLRNE